MCLAVAVADAQPASGPATLTIADAMAAAARRHAGPAEAAARAAAAAEGVNIARAAYLPKIDAMWQVTRATRNNVFGAFFPQFVVPISGPVLGTDSFESAWGSAAGLVFSAEVFDFGRRATQVAEARASQQAAEARAEGARLDASVHAADLFLTVLGATAMVQADTTNVARLETLQTAVTALVSAELRPGADRARVEADVATARSRLYANEQALAVARVRLAVAVGDASGTPVPAPGALLTSTPGGLASPTSSNAGASISSHPSVREGSALAEAAKRSREGAQLAYRPTILLQGALSARGSGALVDGAIDNGSGLWPDIPNWVAGLQVSFPLFDFGVTNARVGQRTALETAAEARRRLLEEAATGQMREAHAMAEAARRIADTAPIRVAAARTSATQARARYDAGLTGIVDVVETERVLAVAESDAALATLALWRAKLALAAAGGDLAPFLAEVATPTGPPAPATK